MRVIDNLKIENEIENKESILGQVTERYQNSIFIMKIYFKIVSTHFFTVTILNILSFLFTIFFVLKF